MAVTLTANFDIYNEETVKRLQEEDPDILPIYTTDKQKDLAYNKKQVTAAISSAVIQGKSIDKIADDLQTRMTSINRSGAIKTARTAVTSAQNGGTLASMKELAAMGFEVQKEWVATLDDRTRPSHRALDGQRRDLDKAFSNGLQYPGDSSGNAAEVWNCRCTMVSYIPEYDSDDEPRVTYAEWEEYKKATGSNSGKITNAEYSAARAWYKKKIISGLTRNLDIDDIYLFSKGAGIADEVVQTIYNTLRPMERKGDFYISEVAIKSISKGADGATPALQIEPVPSGRQVSLILNVNKDFFSGKTINEIDQEFRDSRKSVANSLQEALIHESNHAKLLTGKSIQEIEKLYDELSKIHIDGISLTAHSDGVEALAEIEVLMYRNDVISREALELYSKYMRR